MNDDYDHHRREQDHYYRHRERDHQWRHIRERRERDRRLRDLGRSDAEPGGAVQTVMRLLVLVPALWLVLSILSRPAIAGYDGWWLLIAVVGLLVFVVLFKELVSGLLRNVPALGVGCAAGIVAAGVLQLSGVMGQIAGVLVTPPL